MPTTVARRFWSGISERTAILLVVFGVGLIAVAALFRPWATPAIGPDSAASVLYFDRLAAHQRLEAFVGSTPKPLATLIYGLAFNLVHDWRALSILATLEYPVMIVAGAALAWRTSGPLAAGMTAMGLFGSHRLLEDGALTYATPWAILLWIVAGLALTSKSPRYGVAGAALFLAALLRIETFLILAVAAAALAAWRILPLRWISGGSRPPLRALLLLVGVLALPVMILHDLLLTGNGLFWLNVATVDSAIDPSAVETPRQLASDLLHYYFTAWPLVLLAVVGVFDLVRRRRVVVLLGLAACGLGTLAFLEFLAFRSTYVSYRYTIPADAALVLAAAVGAAAVASGLVGGLRSSALPGALVRAMASERGRDRLAIAAAAVMVGATASYVLAGSNGRFGSAVINNVDDRRAFQADYDRLMPDIASAVAALPDQPDWVLADVLQYQGGPPPRLYVPPLLDSRIAVDLDMPIWSVRNGSPLQGDPADFTIAVPAIAYIDVNHGGDPPAHDQPLEVETVTRVGHVIVKPLVALPNDGLWVVELTPAGD